MFCKKWLLFSLLCFSNFSSFASPTVFVEPDDGYKPILKEISSAQHNLDMAMYILKDKRIIHAFIAAEKRGVSVRVILEKKPYHATYYHPQTIRKKLEHAGIHVKWSDPNFFYFTHEKAFVVDQKRLVIMTLNQTYSAFHNNREYGAIDLSPSDATEFLKTFNGDWERHYVDVSARDLVWSPNNAACKLMNLMKTAKQSISIEVEALQDMAIKNLLFQKAHHGVSVRVILPPQQNRHDMQTTCCRDIDVRILPKKPVYLHAKLIIIDDSKAYVGSENLTSTSLQMNRELGILIDSTNSLKRLMQTFATDWKHSNSCRFFIKCL